MDSQKTGKRVSKQAKKGARVCCCAILIAAVVFLVLGSVALVLLLLLRSPTRTTERSSNSAAAPARTAAAAIAPHHPPAARPRPSGAAQSTASATTTFCSTSTWSPPLQRSAMHVNAEVLLGDAAWRKKDFASREHCDRRFEPRSPMLAPGPLTSLRAPCDEAEQRRVFNAVLDAGFPRHQWIFESSAEYVAALEVVPCSLWSCSCQELSNTFGVHHGQSWGSLAHAADMINDNDLDSTTGQLTTSAVSWWLNAMCKTSPAKVAGAPSGGAIVARGVRDAPVPVPCSAWSCSCQILSDLLRFERGTWGTSSFNVAPVASKAPLAVSAKAWWLAKKCTTSPSSSPKRRRRRLLKVKARAGGWRPTAMTPGWRPFSRKNDAACSRILELRFPRSLGMAEASLGATLQRFAWATHTAVETGRAVVLSGLDRLLPRGYYASDLFRSSGCGVRDEMGSLRPDIKVNAHFVAQQLNTPAQFQSSGMRNYGRAVYDASLMPSPRVLDKLAQKLARYTAGAGQGRLLLHRVEDQSCVMDRGFSTAYRTCVGELDMSRLQRPVVGVHIRHGDACYQCRRPHCVPSLAAVRAILASHGIASGTIVLSSDDPLIAAEARAMDAAAGGFDAIWLNMSRRRYEVPKYDLDELKVAAKEAVGRYEEDLEQHVNTATWLDQRDWTDQSRSENLLDSLVSLGFLALADDVLVGSFSSSFTAVAFGMSRAPRSISLDMAWSFRPGLLPPTWRDGYLPKKDLTGWRIDEVELEHLQLRPTTIGNASSSSGGAQRGSMAAQLRHGGGARSPRT